MTASPQPSATVVPAAPMAVDLPTGAQIAGVGHTKFRELVMAGEIPTLTIGTRRLVRTAAIAEYLERAEARTMAEAPAVTSSGFASRVASRRGGDAA